jgi:hypothetical protein
MPVVIFLGIPRFWKKLLFLGSLPEENFFLGEFAFSWRNYKKIMVVCQISITARSCG